MAAGSSFVAEQPSEDNEGPSFFHNYQYYEDDHFQYPVRTYRSKAKVLIINNASDFKQPQLPRKTRPWSAADVERLKTCFSQSVHIEPKDINVLDNLSEHAVRAQLNQVAESDLSHYASLIVVVLSFGSEGQIFTTDSCIKYQDLVTPFRNRPSLHDKPKFFLVQTEKPDSQSLASAYPVHYPLSATNPITEPDVLFAFNLDPEDICVRTTGAGTLFIQRFCEVLENDPQRHYTDHLDLVNIMTRVNHLVRYDLTSIVQRTAMRKVGCPRFVTQLTKEFRFH